MGSDFSGFAPLREDDDLVTIPKRCAYCGKAIRAEHISVVHEGQAHHASPCWPLKLHADEHRSKDRIKELEADFEKLGAAASKLYLMALNGVVCDPTDACRYCKPYFRDLKDVLDRHDPGWGGTGRSFRLGGK